MREVIQSNKDDRLWNKLIRLVDQSCNERVVFTAAPAGPFQRYPYLFPHLCAKCPVYQDCMSILDNVAAKSAKMQFHESDFNEALGKLMMFGIVKQVNASRDGMIKEKGICLGK